VTRGNRVDSLCTGDRVRPRVAVFVSKNDNSLWSLLLRHEAKLPTDERGYGGAAG
jgi:hypothetical protein